MTTTADEATAAQPGSVRTELDITGMTCGACSARIERRLGRLEGVQAVVNLTTGRARVQHPAATGVDEIVAAVEKLGFGAQPRARALPTPRAPGDAAATDAAAPAATTEQSTGTPPAPRAARSDGAGTMTADDDAQATELAELRHRALTCLAMTIPVIAVAMNPAWQFTYWQWFSLTLAAPVIVWGGWRFHRAAARGLRHGSLTMDTLISIGSLAALTWSFGALFIGEAGLGGVRHDLTLIPQPDVFGGDRTIYLETGAAIVTAVLIGRWVELRGRRRALALCKPRVERPVAEAWLQVGGRELRVPVDNVAPGDDVVVHAGGTIPCDGLVRDGASTLDVQAMTGESVPVDGGVGTRVLAGTRVVEGRVVVRASHVGDETQWARMSRRVEDAQTGKAAVQRLADRVSGRFVPAVLVLSVYTFLFWWFADAGAGVAIAAAMAVLVVACPCALGLATPTALAVATGRGAALGILLRGPETLETTRRIDTVVLDKTGTVTTGDMTLHAVHTDGHADSADVLRRAAALEREVDHPVARAVLAAAEGGRSDPAGPDASVADVERLDGLGVQGTVDGVAVVVGRRLLMERSGALLDDDLAAAHRGAESRGHTAVLVAWPDAPGGDPRVRAVLAVGDTVRETSARGVARMKKMGLRPMLLTGDNAAAAATVAAAVGIDPDDVVAEVLPTDKADVVARLQSQGRIVAMVGDGVNDAAALAQANLGLAMGAGAALALDASDVTLVRNDLGAVADALRLARRTLRTVRTNLFWAFFYNTSALPLAAMGLLNPMIAGVAMGASSVIVVGNSLRLRRFRPGV